MMNDDKGLGASADADRVGGLRPEPTASSQPSGRSPTGAVSPQDGLKCLGFDLNHPQRGSIMIQTDVCRFRHYAFRYRVGDGHILTRLGRVVGAKKMGNGIIAFRVEGR